MKLSLIGALALTSAIGLAGCKRHAPEPQTATAPAAAPLTSLGRADFNRLALESGLPLFWSEDRDHNGALDADELAVVWGMSDAKRTDFVADGHFTQRFLDTYAELEAKKAAPPAALDARHQALEKEIAQTYFTLLASDFSGASAEDRALVTHVLDAARIIERLYAKQVGSFGMEKEIPAGDGLAKLVDYMHHGPWCDGPSTQNDPNCNALASMPAKISGLYPAALQKDAAFCEALAKSPQAKELMTPFAVVVEKEGGLAAVPYNEYYQADMQEVATKLTAAAQAITDPSETALKTYLTAAAKAFIDNDWFAADEAWAKMTAQNSKWYLRIGPDEVYFEPCSIKAGFHAAFARINPGSLAWQEKLEPVKNEMESVLAAHAGKPYAARQVSFHLPDFIDIVLNAGDDRASRGATVGQSLPNWGPVANEGRGRTVVMTNFYTDADSKATIRSQVESMLCQDTVAGYVSDPAPEIMSTVLHEAAHNLGPSHEYAVRGKTDDQIFGGPLASTMEELKAQTAALFFADWLAQKNLITRELADQAHVRDMTWAMGHISRGMYDGQNKPKPYSQLASVQMGYLLKTGAIAWRPDELAANGKDKGCLSFALDKFPKAIDDLTTLVFGLKSRGDVKAAKALKDEFVDGEGAWKDVRGIITERYLRYPRATFLYSVRR